MKKVNKVVALLTTFLGFAACGPPIEDSVSEYVWSDDAGLGNSSSAITLQQAPYTTGKTATQSSTIPPHYASKAVDGDTNGDWATGTTSSTDIEAHPWWQVDLGATQHVRRVLLYNRSDAGLSRLSNFYVFLSANPFTSNDPTVLAADPNVFNVDHPASVGLSESILLGNAAYGRYLRIQLKGTDYLTLAEVQVVNPSIEIPGPNPVATSITWAATGVITGTPRVAIVGHNNQLLTYLRDAAGGLRESVDFAAPVVVPGSPTISTTGISAAAEPDIASPVGRRFVVVRTSTGQTYLGEWNSSWTWTDLSLTSGAEPAVQLACGKVNVAAQDSSGNIWIKSRAIGGGSWSSWSTFGFSRTPPALAASPGGDLGIAFVGSDTYVRTVRQSCSTGSFGSYLYVGGTTNSVGRVGFASYGNRFAVAVQGTDNYPYFAIENNDGSGQPVWGGFEAVNNAVLVQEQPSVFVFRNSIFIAARDTSNQARYWVRNPNTLANLGGAMWEGGRVVGGSGTGSMPPVFAQRGVAYFADNYGSTESMPAELYLTVKGTSDQQLYGLNFGRFATKDILNGVWGIVFDTAFEGNGLAPHLFDNFFDLLSAFLTIPQAYKQKFAAPDICTAGTKYTVIQGDIVDNGGWSDENCGAVSSTYNRTLPRPSTYLFQKRPAWSYWEEFGHQVQWANAATVKTTTYNTLFGAGPRTCTTNADCGSGPSGGTCAVACAECSGGGEQYGSTTMYCQNSGSGQYSIRPQGFIQWYDLYSVSDHTEHSFLDLVEWYRWWGDDLRAQAAVDTAQGNSLLQDKYNYVKTNYFGGVEFNGFKSSLATGSRAAGTYGMPLH